MTTTTPTPTGSRSADAVSRFLDDIVAPGGVIGPDVLARGAVLDATVPMWRMEVVGDDAVRAELASWYSDPGSLDAVRRRPVPGGEAVEIELSWVEGGVPHAVHQLHVLEVEHDRITRDTMWCGGRWPAGLRAEMEAARAE
jgi:hypothetical protein